MSDQRAYVVIASRAHCDYPVAIFLERSQAELYAGWCNRTATLAEYRVADAPLNPLTQAQRVTQAMGPRACGICKVRDIPRGVDWQWWHEGHCVHSSCYLEKLKEKARTF